MAAYATVTLRRHQWYQIADKVVVDVYVKALPRERLRTEFGEKHLKVEVLDEAGESEWDIDVEVRGLPGACMCACGHAMWGCGQKATRWWGVLGSHHPSSSSPVANRRCSILQWRL